MDMEKLSEEFANGWRASKKDNHVDGETSDGYHTFNELYHYRLLYNAALFNEWGGPWPVYDVHKSKKHHDGTIPFDDPKWFIVVAELPTGQISNHYKIEEAWDLFYDVPERELPNVYDGHTPEVAAQRLLDYLKERYNGRAYLS